MRETVNRNSGLTITKFRSQLARAPQWKLEPVKALAAVAGPRYGDVDELETPDMVTPLLMDCLLGLFWITAVTVYEKHVNIFVRCRVFVTIRRSLENMYQNFFVCAWCNPEFSVSKRESTFLIEWRI